SSEFQELVRAPPPARSFSGRPTKTRSFSRSRLLLYISLVVSESASRTLFAPFDFQFSGLLQLFAAVTPVCVIVQSTESDAGRSRVKPPRFKIALSSRWKKPFSPSRKL